MFFPRRLVAMLCVALALVFAGQALSSAVDAIQHAAGAPDQHEHLIFSEFSMESGHADEHVMPGYSSDYGDNGPVDHLPGGHHHHGDNGSGMIVAGFVSTAMVSHLRDRHDMAPERQTHGITMHGPERPPKSLVATV
jgi:hypothetical protein